MTDLSLDTLTPDDARKVEAGHDADFVIAHHIMGYDPEYWTERAEHPSEWVQGDDHVEYAEGGTNSGLPRGLRISRDPRGAKRAREWLREEGFKIWMNPGPKGGVELVADSNENPALPQGKGAAPTEELATARLLLTLHAEGALDD